MSFGRRRLLAIIALAPLLARVPAAVAETDAERTLEQRVKAAFLYRFTEFVSWPDAAFARADAPFVIAVVASEPVAEALRGITAGRAVGGRPVEVRRIGAAEAIPPSQVVFVAGSDSARVRETARSAPRHALIVTEAEGALDAGSVINFVIDQGKVRFDIALDAAEKRAIRLSSRLLAVARTVRGT